MELDLNTRGPEAGGMLESFWAPARKQGDIVVELVPAENVRPGQRVLVTFGLPLPQGSLTSEGLCSLRADIAGQEVPLHVDAMAMWRSLTQGDTPWVRIARIQLEVAFEQPYPSRLQMRLAWGGGQQGQRRPGLVDPSTAWHLVDSDTFPAALGVYEPDVYALLPVDIGCDGVLKMQRMAPAVPMREEQDDAADILACAFDGDYSCYDHAMKNFCYPLLNRDDPRVSPQNRWNYANVDGKAGPSDKHDWMYDRAAAMFQAYGRTGFFFFLREAVRICSFYRLKIMEDGFFEYMPGDERNQLAESMVYTAWLTGAPHMLDKLPRMVQASVSRRITRWRPDNPFWTERHAGLILLTNLMAYEALGGEGQRLRCVDMVQDLLRHQDGWDGLLPQGRVDGGLYHYGLQHDPAEFNLQSSLASSPWMSVLVFDSMLRAFALSGSRAIAAFLSRFGHYFVAASKTDAWHRYLAYTDEKGELLPLTYPDYLMRADGASERRENTEHDINVCCALAWADYFTRLLTGGPGEGYLDCAERLYYTYKISTRHWTHPDNPERGLPAFHMSPWRRYGWQYRTSMALSWLMAQLGGKGGHAPDGAGCLPAALEPLAEDAVAPVVQDVFTSEVPFRLFGRRMAANIQPAQGLNPAWQSAVFPGTAGIRAHNRLCFTTDFYAPEPPHQPIGLWNMRPTDRLELAIKVEGTLPPEGGLLRVCFNGDGYAQAPGVRLHVPEAGRWQRYWIDLAPMRPRLDGCLSMLDILPEGAMGQGSALHVAGIRIVRPGYAR
nr:hypothetical protein [bacterium]